MELTVYYIEKANDSALDYGEINERFYSSIESMLDAALKMLKNSPDNIIEEFLPRLRTVVSRADGMKWGYYDYIADAVEGAFPE